MDNVIKRLMALIGCAALSLTALGGCGDNDDGSNSGSDSSDEGTSSAMRDITSMELVSEMTLGYNLGNSLDVCNADRDGDGVANETADVVDETLWGNPTVTKEQIEFVKDSGFNSIRIPVTWRDHLDDEYNIDEDWMNRVQEVVDYAYDLDMYVIINIHHDGGGDPDFGAWVRNASTDYDGVLEKYQTIWQQICDRFEDYGDKLIFESMNEVGFDDLSSDEAYETLNSLNQAFVDLVRSSGGNNPERHLLIAGYWTDIAMTCDSKFVMPDDPADRCIVSVHYYTPWEFCTTTQQYEWGTDDEVALMESKVEQMKTTFVDNGIPVIIGEYGTCLGNDEESRVKFCETFVKLCTDAGMATYIWDDGGLFIRDELAWQNEDIITAIKSSAGVE
ncbi:MAG: glycoside hydrolase family 5 protein [Ruminococcus sp.]|nr:glycoside hydrolase family 5 protein [Ruminococcus sp.]